MKDWKELEYNYDNISNIYRYITPCPRDNSINICSGACCDCDYFEGNFPTSKKIRCTFKPKAPTHSEIMKPDRYWRGCDDDGFMVWEKADLYREDNKPYLIHDNWRSRDYFSGRSFSDRIPPEAT